MEKRDDGMREPLVAAPIGDAQGAMLGRSQSQPPPQPPLSTMGLRPKYIRANALVASILNKYYNGSSRAVDPFVIRCLQEEETRLFSLQCFIEQGPTEATRGRKESAAMHSSSQPLAPASSTSGTFVARLFGVCGGYLGGPGSVMRQWDRLSETTDDAEGAMAAYIGLVDRILPGWDHALEYPIAQQDKFWRDDEAVAQCQACGAPFTVQHRRHHCRMCLEIFCAACCGETLEMALCPGAPVRPQRVCGTCFAVAEKDRSLLEIRRVIRANHDIEQQIKDLQAATEGVLAAKHHEELKLRHEAEQCGCDLTALEAAIQRQIGSPVRMSVRTPPAHKFLPNSATVEANDQLALAHRQLLMGLKVAQCRAKKAIDKMDVTLAVLRQAICFGTSSWNVVLRRLRGWLTLGELRSLGRTARGIRAGIARYRLEAACVRDQPIRPATWRPFLWQQLCLEDDGTRAFLGDLAEALRARLGDNSDSETEEDDDSGDDNNRHEPDVAPTAATPMTSSSSTRSPMPPTPLNGLRASSASSSVSSVVVDSRGVQFHTLLSLTSTASSTDLAERASAKDSLWQRLYEFILARCETASSSSSALADVEAQIHSDVQRTFGVSSLRHQHQQQHSGAHKLKTYVRAESLSPEAPVGLRKVTLTNVLRAIASVHSEIGYCQGMDSVAAVLLSVVEWRESEAFWLLLALLVAPKYQLDQLYGPELPQLNLRFYQLDQLLARHLPELHEHLQEEDFPVSMFATGWFLTLFTNMETLQYDVVLRVLDGFLVAGWKHLFRVALVILEELQHHLLASPFDEIPGVFYDIALNAPRLQDPAFVTAGAMRFKVTTRELETLARAHERDVADPMSPTRRSSIAKFAANSTRRAEPPSHVPGVMDAQQQMQRTSSTSSNSALPRLSVPEMEPSRSPPNSPASSPVKRTRSTSSASSTTSSTKDQPHSSGGRRRSRNSSKSSDSTREATLAPGSHGHGHGHPNGNGLLGAGVVVAPPNGFIASPRAGPTSINHDLAPINANYYF